MDNDFAPFELAVKLKEKGFMEPCVSFYALENFTAEYVDSCGDCYEVDFEKGILYLNYPLRYNKFEEKMLPAPTISQVLKWLRKEKEIDIVIYPIDVSTVFMGGEKYILSVYISRKRDYKLHHDNKDKYVEWEDIEYVFNNLI